MPATWTCLLLWMFVVQCRVLSCGSQESERAEDGSYPSQTPHIHQHNGHTTSPNSSDIIREEGMYFLKLLFAEYGAGNTMDVSNLEKLLDNVGYISSGEDHQSYDGQDHSHHEDHGPQIDHSDHEENQDDSEFHIHEEDHAEDQGEKYHTKHEDLSNEDHTKLEDHGNEDRTIHEDHTQLEDHSNEDHTKLEDHGNEDHTIHEDHTQLEGHSNEDHTQLEGHSNEDHTKHENLNNKDHTKLEDHGNEDRTIHEDHTKLEDHGNEDRTIHEDHTQLEDHGNEDRTIHEDHTKLEDHGNEDHTKLEDHSNTNRTTNHSNKVPRDPEHQRVHEEDHSDYEKENGTVEGEHDVHAHGEQRGNNEEEEGHRKGKGKHTNHKGNRKDGRGDQEDNLKVRKRNKHHHEETLHEGRHSMEGDGSYKKYHKNNETVNTYGVDQVHLIDNDGNKSNSSEHGLNLNGTHGHSGDSGSRGREVNSSENHEDVRDRPNEHNRQHSTRTGDLGQVSENHNVDRGELEFGEENNHKSIHTKTRKSKYNRKQKDKKRRKGKKKGRKQRKKDRSPSRDKRSAEPAIFHKHDIHTECMTIQQLTEIFHFDKKSRISQKDFLYMSPAIIYQLDQPHCRRSSRSNVHEHKTASKDVSAKVWGYSSAAVLVISLVGLLGVAVIPIMQKVFYNQLLQFLVAMAVGALTGDAMLHLLPHAIAGEESSGGSGDGHNHSAAVWKGLSGLAGIYIFFIIQRILTIVSGLRNERHRNEKAARTIYTNASHASKETTVPKPDIEQLQPLKVKDAEGEFSEGHSHGSHGHSHHDGTIPTSVSAVAWMVILGDGVHNFSDGLAIGAAFASSITGGFSTAIAVFCHELPHEIGDFAVLLKSGMSVKKAVLYNVVSSALCFLGMLIGVALGNIHEASTWIFAGVAGMFIYISLVTMIPELTSVNSQKPVRDLFLQCCGLCVGSGIMLTIAIYENELKTMLD